MNSILSSFIKFCALSFLLCVALVVPQVHSQENRIKQGELFGVILLLLMDNADVEPIGGPVLTPKQVDIDIIRFLNQATFGANEDSYNELRAQINTDGSNRRSAYERWIDRQLDMPGTTMTDLMEGTNSVSTLGNATRFERQYTFWTLAVQSPDQLRHRLAQTLSEIFVISDNVNDIFNAYRGITDYWDMLAASGTGSYKTLLSNVTRHPVMGVYLSSIQNRIGDPATHNFPDENYAREVMQLFSFGLVHLNKNGSEVLDSNRQPIPTYDNKTITEMARVFTGLGHSYRDFNGSVLANNNFTNRIRNSQETHAQWRFPMRFFPEVRDFGRKELFSDQGQQVVINAGASTIAGADTELAQVIDAIVGHSSTAPRISRLLIQQLVTSNPSPAYIARVANAFGEDGDMRAVIKAILLDEEARNPNMIEDIAFGKQKSPIFQLTSFLRVTDATSLLYIDGRNSNYRADNVDSFDEDTAFLRIDSFDTVHQNLEAPSVFNFYSPDYQPPGEFANRSLVAPEMELLTETSIVSTLNNFFSVIDGGSLDRGRASHYEISEDDMRIRINRDRLTAIFDDAPGNDRDKAGALVDYLDFYYNASQIALTNDISGSRDIIIDAVVSSTGDDRLNIALYGVVNAPESVVQK